MRHRALEVEVEVEVEADLLWSALSLDARMVAKRVFDVAPHGDQSLEGDTLLGWRCTIGPKHLRVWK